VVKIADVRRVPVDCPNEEQVGEDNTQSLKDDRLGRCILQIIHSEHFRIEEDRDLREKPFEVSKEGRIVQRPFTRFLSLDQHFHAKNGTGGCIPLYTTEKWAESELLQASFCGPQSLLIDCD
jgi:hypothetical protein